MDLKKLRKSLDIKHQTIRAIMRTKPIGAELRELNGKYFFIFNFNFHFLIFICFIFSADYLRITNEPLASTVDMAKGQLEVTTGVHRVGDRYYSTV